MTYVTSALAGILAFSASTAFAEPTTEMPNVYFDNVAAKLIMAGFTNVHMINFETNKMAAYDEWGSEVLITVHPSNRQVLKQTYVHQMDE